MVKLEQFSSLTRNREDLLSKPYCYGSFGVVNVEVDSDNLTFHARSSLRNENEANKVRASSWLKFQLAQASLKAKKRTDGLSHYTIEWVPKDLIPDLKLKSECKVSTSEGSQTAEPSLTAEYSMDNLKAKLAFADNPRVVKGSFTTAFGDYGVGLDGKFDISSKRLTGYNTAVWWNYNDKEVVLKHLGTNKEKLALGEFQLSYYYRKDKIAFGSLVSSNWQNKSTYMELGGDYDYDDITVLSGKINSEGKVGAALKRKLNPYLTLRVASEVDATKVSSSAINNYKFGFRFDFNH